MTTPRFIIRRAAGDVLRPWYLIDTKQDSKPYFRRVTHTECIRTAETMRYMEYRATRYPGAVYTDSLYPTPDGYGLILEDLRTPPKHIYQRTSTVLTPAHPEEEAIARVKKRLEENHKNDVRYRNLDRTHDQAMDIISEGLGPREEDPVYARVEKRLDANDARVNYLREKAIKRDRARAHARDDTAYRRSQQETLEHHRAPDTHTRKFFLRLWRALTS